MSSLAPPVDWHRRDLGEFAGRGVGVIIPTMADTPLLRRAIWSVRTTADLPCEIIVLPSAQGVAANRNACLERCAHDLVAFLDDDVLLVPQWLSGLVAVLAAHPDVRTYVIANHGWGESARIRATTPGADGPLLAAAASCHAPFDEVSILWNGDVVLCCFDYDGSNVIGNLSAAPLEAIWHGERATELRRLFAERRTATLPLCEGCYLAPHEVGAARGFSRHKSLAEERLILSAYDCIRNAGG